MLFSFWSLSSAGIIQVKPPKFQWNYAQYTALARQDRFLLAPILPHKCGVPLGHGTPHLCGSEEFFVRPLPGVDFAIALAAGVVNRRSSRNC
jgi:hypothetical protein